MKKEILKEMCKAAVEGLITGIIIVVMLALTYKFCYHIDGQHSTLGSNYVTIEERFTDFFGNDIAKWERKIEKNPMEIVIYKKWF